MVLPLEVKKIKVNKSKFFKAAISPHTTIGAKDMEMRVKVSTSACCLKYNNTANIHLLFKPITDHILEEGMPTLHKFAQKLGIMIEPFPELFWNRKHDMAIPHPGKKSSTYIIYPLICVYLSTGETETALATEGNLLHLTAMKVPVRYKSILRISTPQHLLDRLIIILCLVSRIHLLKLRPVVYEYLLKYILVVIWDHANKIHNSALKYNYFIYNRDLEKKEIPIQSS